MDVLIHWGPMGLKVQRIRRIEGDVGIDKSRGTLFNEVDDTEIETETVSVLSLRTVKLPCQVCSLLPPNLHTTFTSTVLCQF